MGYIHTQCTKSAASTAISRLECMNVKRKRKGGHGGLKEDGETYKKLDLSIEQGHRSFHHGGQISQGSPKKGRQ